MRNVLVHGYFAVDTDIIWDTVKHDILQLKPGIERLLEMLRERGD